MTPLTPRQRRENIRRNEDRVRDCMMLATDEMEIGEYGKAAGLLRDAAGFAERADVERLRGDTNNEEGPS